MMEGATIEFSGLLRRETEKAYLIDFGTEETWIPKSQCERIGDDTWLLTRWIVEQKDLYPNI